MNLTKPALFSAAIEAQKYSHSPYSNKKIGAAIELQSGKIYSGSNIENASFGGTVCAERVAIWKSYSENSSSIKIRCVLVVSDEIEPWPPCGFCRQVIAEFADEKTEVLLCTNSGIERKYLFKDIFPHAFLPENLKKL
jgi:cytidine deaminase